MWISTFVLLLTATVCLGDASRSKRMVGGVLAPHVPWQALVFISDQMQDGGFGGGALIAKRWVLTSARNLFVHKSQLMTEVKDPVVPKVFLGISSRDKADSSNEVDVEKVFVHPGFQNNTDWENDLALILLKKAVQMSDLVAPIPLPGPGQDLADRAQGSGMLAGWGYGATLEGATYIKELSLPLVNHSECHEEYEGSPLNPEVDETMFCTGRTRFEENVCFGDAGGALVALDPETKDAYVAGILSYDKACTLFKYAVYMKVSHYLPWIYSVMRGDAENAAELRYSTMVEMMSRQQ